MPTCVETRCCDGDTGGDVALAWGVFVSSVEAVACWYE